MSAYPSELDGVIDILRRNPRQALEICERYVSEHPDDPHGLFSRFQVLDTIGEHERALADIDRVLELDPDWIGYSSRGHFFHNVGDYQRAIEDLTHAREIDQWEWEHSFDPHFRADSLARLGRLDEALADCALIEEDHWMPGVLGLPAGNKQEFIEEIKRRAALARSGKS